MVSFLKKLCLQLITPLFGVSILRNLLGNIQTNLAGTSSINLEMYLHWSIMSSRFSCKDIKDIEDIKEKATEIVKDHGADIAKQEGFKKFNNDKQNLKFRKFEIVSGYG